MVRCATGRTSPIWSRAGNEPGTGDAIPALAVARPSHEAAAARGCWTRRSSSPTTASARCRNATSEQPFSLEHGGPQLSDRLRAGRVRVQPVRRQLELARPGLDADELPADRIAAASSTATTATISRWSARSAPGKFLTLNARSPTSSPAGSTRLFLRGRDGPPGAFGDVEAAAGRPGTSAITCCSTSISTATPAAASGPRTRPAGPRWWPCCSSPQPPAELSNAPRLCCPQSKSWMVGLRRP